MLMDNPATTSACVPLRVARATAPLVLASAHRTERRQLLHRTLVMGDALCQMRMTAIRDSVTIAVVMGIARALPADSVDQDTNGLRRCFLTHRDQPPSYLLAELVHHKTGHQTPGHSVDRHHQSSKQSLATVLLP